MSNSLNILLFTFGHAGVQAIRSLRAAGQTISACFTHPTTQAWLPSVEQECRKLDIPCSTDPSTADISLASRPDVVLSIFYRRKIEMPFLALGTIGAFNVAASQLPRYRGYFPYRWAILNNESSWGVTVHQLTQNYCDGAILHRKPMAIKPRENAYELSLRIADAAATAATEAVARLAAGDDHLASVDPVTPQFFGPQLPFNGIIDWHQSAARIDSFIRALDFGRQVGQTYQHLTPPARSNLHDQTISIYQSNFGGTMSSYPPGTITRCDDQVWVQAGRGHLVIEKINVNGKDYNAAEYFAACGVTPGDMFDATHAWSTQPQPREFSHAA